MRVSQITLGTLPIGAKIETQKDQDAPMLDDVDTNFVYGG